MIQIHCVVIAILEPLQRPEAIAWFGDIKSAGCVVPDDPLSSGSSHSIQAADQDHFLLFSDQLQNHAATNGVRAAKVANRIATYHVLSEPLLSPPYSRYRNPRHEHLRRKCRSFAMFKKLIR